MKKHTLLLLMLFSTVAFAQEDSKEEEKNDFWENVRFGGGIGLNFGNNSTTLGVSPTAIYDFNDAISLGLGVGYQYSKRGDFKSNIFNGSALALFNPFEGAQLSAEFEQLFVNREFDNENTSYDYPSLHLGVAYTAGRNVSFGVRYDVLYDKEKSIYSSAVSPIVRIFF